MASSRRLQNSVPIKIIISQTKRTSGMETPWSKTTRVRPRSAGPKLALFGGIVDRSSTPKLGFEGRHVPLRSCRGLVEFQSPSAAHGLRRDAGLVMKTAFLAPHAPRPCLPVWPCLGHACPRVLPVTTLHDDGLLGRAARRFVKK